MPPPLIGGEHGWTHPTPSHSPVVGSPVDSPMDPGRHLHQLLRAERMALQQDLERRHMAVVQEFEHWLGQRSRGNTSFGQYAFGSRQAPKPDPFTPRGDLVEVIGDEVERPRSRFSASSQVSSPSGTKTPRFNLNFDDEFKDMGMLERAVRGSAFEMAFGVLILINTFVMILEVQYEGVNSDRIVRYSSEKGPTASDVWPGMSVFLPVCEWLFGIAFTVELLLKVAGMGRWFCSPVNIFDLIIVVLWLGDKLTVSMGGGEFAINPMLLRFCRLARLLRLVKALKWMEVFDALQVLIASIKGSASVLFWSSLLLAAIMLVCSMLFNHFLRPFIRDDTESGASLAERQLIYKYFGSFSRAMVTMLELTLGNWVPVCRLLMDSVNEWYGAVIMTYKIVVGFGVVKVITGCFLHETFKVASTNDEIMVMQKHRENASHRAKMERFFAAADGGGDGTLTLDEFTAVLAHESVRTWLAAMEISTDDVSALFSLLVREEDGTPDGEPRVSVTEFLQGTMRLKGMAKSLDVWRVLTQIDIVRRNTETLAKQLAPTPHGLRLGRSDTVVDSL